MKTPYEADSIVERNTYSEELIEKNPLTTSFLTIDLSAISHNIAALKNFRPLPTLFMAMIKASAYGTDLETLAFFLAENGIDIFGVAHLSEAIFLREKGFKAPIFVTHATPLEAPFCVDYEVEVSLDSLDFFYALEQACLLKNKKIKAHLHIDTGMNRFGCKPPNLPSLLHALKKAPWLELKGVYTHFTSAENPLEDTSTLSQEKIFQETLFLLQKEGFHIPIVHASNSSHFLRFERSYYNMVRLGLSLYGLSLSSSVKEKLFLKPALTLKAKIVSIYPCKQGETISYGKKYSIEKEEALIAVLAIGYADGIHKSYAARGEVLVHGKKASIVGSICMDFLMIDISHIPEAKVGDFATLFGQEEKESLSAETFSMLGGTICHELISCLGPRIQRLFKI